MDVDLGGLPEGMEWVIIRTAAGEAWAIGRDIDGLIGALKHCRAAGGDCVPPAALVEHARVSAS